jgi:ABC-type multidrug transport system fused ATPase/permease subunit
MTALAAKPMGAADAPGAAAAVAREQHAAAEMYGTDKLRARKYAASGYDSAGLGSRLLFSWIAPLVSLGHARPLTEEDLPDLPASQKAEGVARMATERWAAAAARAAQSGAEPKLAGMLWGMVACEVAWSALAELVRVGLQFAGPVITSVLVQYFFDTEAGEPKDSTGWLCVAAMLVLPIFGGLAKVHQTNALTNVGVTLKTALTALVFEKATLLSAAGKAASSRGAMINLVAQDAEKLLLNAPRLNMVWSAPASTAACLVLISRQIGVAPAFAGFGMLWIGFVLLGLVFGGLAKFQKAKMVHSDSRVDKMSEVLRGIKILKLYGWEEAMAAAIDLIRAKEVVQLRKQIWAQAAMQIVLLSIPSLMALISFKVFVHNGGVADPALIFTTLVLFELLRWALMNIPQAIIAAVEISVALRRTRRFLQAPEIVTAPWAGGDDSAAVVVENCSFKWNTVKLATEGGAGSPEPEPELEVALELEPEPEPSGVGNVAALRDVSLRDVSLRVVSGSLCLVCGGIGAGKSTLLAALLDELEVRPGAGGSAFGYGIVGRTAYVAQEAWIQNLSVRENVLFGRPYDRRRFERVVEACALQSDLDLMPRGDLTEIGERGVNLSGGQKQRIAIARAIYSDADVYLFDDPLSAVDPEVAKHDLRPLHHRPAAGQDPGARHPRAELLRDGRPGRLPRGGRGRRRGHVRRAAGCGWSVRTADGRARGARGKGPRRRRGRAEPARRRHWHGGGRPDQRHGGYSSGGGGRRREGRRRAGR